MRSTGSSFPSGFRQVDQGRTRDLHRFERSLSGRSRGSSHGVAPRERLFGLTWHAPLLAQRRQNVNMSRTSPSAQERPHLHKAAAFCGPSSDRHGEMRRSATRSLSIGLEPGGAGDDVIPGIVGVVEHWDDGAFEDIISNIECPTRDIRPAGSPEMIEDSVV